MALLHRYAALDDDAPERDTIMEQLVSTFLPVVEQVVARYAGRHHTSREDLVQTGAAAMVAAIDRWDPDRAKGDFLGYLVPCVRGEIKRYFRDRTWATSVPRPVKDLGIAIAKASDPLAQRLGRAPRPSELADALGVDREDVVEALAAKADQHATPLCAVDDETGDTYDTLGAVDAAFGHIEDQELLRPLVVRLTAREQRILVLRFFEDRTQSEIGAELGLSQMHVSRLLSRTLATLRRGLEDADRRRPDPPRSA
ncbi:MAG: sigma-70 family RNA polymerase sigma factor [Pseudonocardia sp.]|nr:sigma-70 family RNA polymerase sigma factor [Pseudonocardia sp.]